MRDILQRSSESFLAQVSAVYTCPCETHLAYAAPQQHLNFLLCAIQSEITLLLSWEYVSYYTRAAELFRVSAESLALSRQPSAPWDLQRRSHLISAFSHCVLFALSVAKNTGCCCSHREIMASSVRNPPDSLSTACLRHVGGRTD
jgi:hypothetical protein